MNVKPVLSTLALLGAASFLGACATPSTELADCAQGDVRLTQDFSGSPAYACTRTGPASFQLTVAPESAPINPSPWFAFDLEAERETGVSVQLDYGEYEHRYRPEINHGDGIWAALPDTAVRLEAGDSVAVINVMIGPGIARIAGQEVFGVEDRAQWRAEFAARNGLTRQTIGQSIDGQPVEALSRSASAQNAPLIVILGGQHPPEVTGVLGLRAFLETLFGSASGDNPLDLYEWLIVPDLNPDGVDRGHWRQNLGRMDLNRDWGPFTQPETAAVLAELETRVSEGHVPFLMLDFHSTHRDVLYTPPDDLGLSPDNFAADWIAILNGIWPGEGEAFARGPGHNPDLPTSKTWFATRFGAPGITVEFGDETDRDRITMLAETAARALRIYLEDAQAENEAAGPLPSSNARPD